MCPQEWDVKHRKMWKERKGGRELEVVGIGN